MWRWPLTNMVTIARRMNAEGLIVQPDSEGTAFPDWIDQRADVLEERLQPLLVMPQAYNFGAQAELVLSGAGKAEEAAEWLKKYLTVLRMERAAGATQDTSVNFKLLSSLRQWTRLIKDDSPELVPLRIAMQMMLLDEGETQINLPPGSAQMMRQNAGGVERFYQVLQEANHGDGTFVPTHPSRGVIATGESIGVIIEASTGRRLGTGFAVQRGAVCPTCDHTVDALPVLVTNAHLVSWPKPMYIWKDGESILPENVRVIFEGMSPPQLFELDPIWVAPRDSWSWLDVAILDLRKDGQTLPPPLPIDPVERIESGKVWLHGYPNGGDLRFSIGHNSVVAPRPATPNREHLLHYTTLSTGGSSGSPVLRLDADNKARVVALHIGASSSFSANVGVYMDRIVTAARCGAAPSA